VVLNVTVAHPSISCVLFVNGSWWFSNCIVGIISFQLRKNIYEYIMM